MRSMVLAPIEPVAPRMVMRRSPSAGPGFERASVTVIGSPYHKAACGIIEAAAQHADQTTGDRGRPKTVEPVHHAAMSGNKVAGVLGAEPALDPRFKQIAELRHDRQQQSDNCNRSLVERPEKSRDRHGDEDRAD